MAFKISTGLANHIMATDDVASGLNGGVIKIYGAATSQVDADALVPATANAAIGAALLLVTISNNGAGTGITMDSTPVSGVLYKATGETWLGTVVASGYPSFYRYSAIADAGASSTTEKRVQGSVGVLGTDLVLGSGYLTIANEQRIDSYAIGIPLE